MNPNYAQRRRLAVALAITAIAVPSVLLFGDDGDDESAASVTLVGQVVMPGATTTMPTLPPDGSGEGPLGTTPSAYLGGTVAPPSDDPATIAIARPTDAQRGLASYDDRTGSVSSCWVRDAPYQADVRITNLDNSRTIRCVANVQRDVDDVDVILHRDAFAQIGDLTDAPIPIEYSW